MENGGGRERRREGGKEKKGRQLFNRRSMKRVRGIKGPMERR